MSYDTVFENYRKRGFSEIDASYHARQWMKRQRSDRHLHCSSTHCERGGECRSPNDCFSSVLKAEAKAGQE